MSETTNNLWQAFAGESQANRKYLAFAKQAEKEGFAQAAKLFRAAAEAETVHAHFHLRALKAVKTTEENLKEAIAGETHEFESMYPPMLAKAKEEGEKVAEKGFYYANEVEKVHAGLFQEALNSLANLPETDYYVCSACGYTCENEPPEKCPVCGVKQNAFFKVE